MIKIVNKKTHVPTPNDIYVGRGSVLGNPYTSIQGYQTKAEFICASREESLGKFYHHILDKIAKKDKPVCDELNRIWKLAKEGKDINLVCYCVPQSCHATIIKKIIEEKLDKHRTYKGSLNDLKEGEIAVVGTNTEGRHGKGFAQLCLQKFGAIYGQARGLQGRSYGIVTKDLTKKKHPSRTPEEVKQEIKGLYDFARINNQFDFMVPYNCESKNLNFYSAREMADFFGAFDIPQNIVFEEEFYKLIKL